MVATRRDPLRILEAIYTFDNDDASWLKSLVDALEPYAWKGGLAAYTTMLGERPAIATVENRTRMPTALIHLMPKVFPTPLFRHLHNPIPLSFSNEVWPVVGSAFGVPQFSSEWSKSFGVPPGWAFCGGDLDVKTALVVFHCHPGDAPTPADRAVLDQLSAHLGSVIRLRRLIAPEPAASDASVGAVLSPEGSVLHAEGDERSESDRASLIDAVRRTEKAKLRRATTEERLEVWTALVEGRWSLLENTERDGKRLLLAYRNAPTASPIRGLTSRERVVAQYAALGHSLKFIAYELGISIATAGLDLENATRKLGLTNRAQLIQFFARAKSS